MIGVGIGLGIADPSAHASWHEDYRAGKGARGECADCHAPAWRKPDGTLARLCRKHLDEDNVRNRPGHPLRKYLRRIERALDHHDDLVPAELAVALDELQRRLAQRRAQIGGGL